MTLIKRDYTDNETLITAKNLNDIQDAVIALEDGLFTAENSASGMAITLTDASKRGFTSFSIYGKTTQNGTPTPDNPVELVNIGKGNITVNVMGEKGLQSMTIATPNGLPGVPVPSGGNYTDANGQQWICDEIDLARGVYVQRTGLKIFVGNEVYEDHVANVGFVSSPMAHKGRSPAKCTHSAFQDSSVSWANSTYVRFKASYFNVSTASEFRAFIKEQYEAGTPFSILYILDSPIEIPLSTEEIAAYATLHGYKNYTQVTNDAGAWMELEYIMDAKKYIDQIMATK